MHDLIIIGGGPGGYVAAERAGAKGLSVLLIEKSELGGTCLNRGCIPTKALLNAAKHYLYAKDSEKLGVMTGACSFDMARAQAWKDESVLKLRQGVEFLMKKHKVEVVKGEARFIGPRKLAISGRDETFEGGSVIIATGSVPALPPIPGLAGNQRCVTSDEILSVKAAPSRLVVIGGGVIGIEFASFFASVGCEVTVVEMLPEILPFMDRECVGILKRGLKGIKLVTGAKVERIEGGTVHYSREGEAASAEGDLVLVATGRKPALQGLGLEAGGVEYGPKGIKVDDFLASSAPGVWAIGDATGRSLLAHSASAMGEAAVDGVLSAPRSIAWHAIPWAVYSIPDAAGCGMTEEEAKAKGLDYVKAVVQARANGRFVAENGIAGQGCAKILAEKSSGRILGATTVGGYGSEAIWGVQPFVARGSLVSELAEAIFPHPTVSELLRDCAIELATR